MPTRKPGRGFLKLFSSHTTSTLTVPPYLPARLRQWVPTSSWSDQGPEAATADPTSDNAPSNLSSSREKLIELDVGDRLRICGIEPGGLIEPQSTDRLRRSWYPNWYPKLPETGRVSGVLQRTTDPLTP